jgi:hypothetical protein
MTSPGDRRAMGRIAERVLPRVRAACLAFPTTTERLSHGAPTFFVGEKKSFATFSHDHHGDGIVALICAAPPGAQEALVGMDPSHYYVPPYVGHLGWVGVRLDRALAWEHVLDAIRSAFLVRAPKTLAAALLQTPEELTPGAASKKGVTPRKPAPPKPPRKPAPPKKRSTR